jgi:dynein heavy chain
LLEIFSNFNLFYRGKLDDEEWRFLLTGGVALDNKYRNPAPGWLLDKSWAEIVRCSNMPVFSGLRQHFEKNVCFRVNR